MLPDNQLKFLLALLKLYLVGPKIWKLLNEPADWQALWEGNALRKYLNTAKKEIFDRRHELASPDEELARLKEENIQTIYINDENYSPYLKEIASPPLLLFAKGNLSLLREICFSVIGSRQATLYSQESVKHLLDKAILEKYVIVSGFATGIDSLAHRHTLNYNGKTIAVLGYGFNKDHCYPASNRKLWKDIEEHGLIISEFYPASKTEPQDFACRNRIIAGLSQAVLIIQAREKSGSLITADLALQFNRDILVIPSRINDDNFLGSHQLIQNGAKLIHSVQDLKSNLTLFNNSTIGLAKTGRQLSISEQSIINLLYQPKTLDELLEKQKLSWPELVELLQEMEIKKLIKKTGAYYSI